MSIRELDKKTSEQIAAGEVIENPASVVKELIENSIDAGATRIEVSTEGGGKKRIAVTDNGIGISPEELPLAFKRFATSKLNRLDDLDNLTSLGFRGEALPSIAAVSKVTMVSRIKGRLAGSQIEIHGGNITNHCEAGAPPGTRVEVRDLFFNTPGRQKFLRADSVESSRISSLLTALALAHPQVAFVLTSNGKRLFNSSGDGVLRHVMAELYGNDIAEALLEIKGKEAAIKMNISGYITVPHQTRSTRRWITLIINGRIIKNALLVNALQRGYGDLLPRNRFPMAVLHLNLPGQEIDVNVHPAKEEVRFQKPELIKNLLYRTVKAALLQGYNLPEWPEAVQPKHSETIPSLFEASAHYEPGRIHFNETNVNAKVRKNEDSDEKKTSDQYYLIGQYLQSYLVVQKDDDLLLIDQHAAHERVNYHHLSCPEPKHREERGIQLTLPLTLDLPIAWQEQMATLVPLLREYGFDINPIDDNSYVIRAVPFMARNQPGTEELYDILAGLIEKDNYSEEEKREAIRKTLACHRSVKARQHLSRAEMEQLLNEWAATPDSNFCPHGRPTVISFDRSKLEKSFHRKGN
jgi:DNA mismatch repair protein MutL